MSTTQIDLTDPNAGKTINWEVVLRTDEHIIQAISELISRNYLFDFDKAFLGSLISWFDKRGKLTPKQSQSAIKSLTKRYCTRLTAIYNADGSSFKAYIDATTPVLDEEFLEIVDEFNTLMECPVCDRKHMINTGAYPIICNDTDPDRQTVKCDKCHTTITFQKGEANES